MTSYCNLVGNPKYYLNIGETAVYLNCSPNRTVHSKGENTVSIMVGGSSSTRFALAVTIAMGNRTMAIWYNSGVEPYIAGYNSTTGLLLDDFKCNQSESFILLLEESNVQNYKIPPHYTALLQPCNVGINKSLKDRLNKCASNWRKEKHRLLTPGSKLPTLSRIDVLNWLKKIWIEFPTQIVQNSFTGSGHFY